jgi:hypothetical protein
MGMFGMKSCDLGFLDGAPHRFVNRATLDGDANSVFDLLTDGEIEGEWFPDFKRITWLTAAPHGAKSARLYELTYMRLKEQFLVWERGRRLCFYMTEWSIPMLRRCMEHYELVSRPDGRTDLVWTVCFEPRTFTRPLVPFAKLFWGRDFREATARLTRLVGRRSRRDHAVVANPLF